MILVECFNDESFLRGLGFPSRRIEHHASKGRVAKALEKKQGPAIALVDEDPGAGQPAYLQKFQEVEKPAGLRMRLLHCAPDQKWLVEVQPDLEPWIVETARLAKVSLKSHYLPDSSSALHLNPKAYAERLRGWAAAMLASGCPRCGKLRHWLSSKIEDTGFSRL
jgi:hypothetical protein